jgi:hypothetical protein
LIDFARLMMPNPNAADDARSNRSTSRSGSTVIGAALRNRLSAVNIGG